jgi:selT/selW/selH-like putative selenoprotein
LAASLRSRFGEEVEITPGSLGQFDVLTGDQLVFSKKEAGRFPDPDEVEDRFALSKAGKELPPIESGGGRGWFVGRLVSKLRG